MKSSVAKASYVTTTLGITYRLGIEYHLEPIVHFKSFNVISLLKIVGLITSEYYTIMVNPCFSSK
jgi:hypothetical protein